MQCPAQPYSLAVCAQPPVVFPSGYAGSAKLVASTTAVSAAGGSLTLTSSADLQVSARGVVQDFVGFSGYTCGTPTDPCAVPGTVAVQPAQIVSQNAGPQYYAVYQTTRWKGTFSATFRLIEAGQVVETISDVGCVAKEYAIAICLAGGFIPAGYTGPATL